MSTRQLKRQHARAERKRQKSDAKQSNFYLRDRLTELAQLVGGLQIAQEAMLQALIKKGVMSADDFRKQVVDFNSRINETAARLRAAEKAAKDEHAACLDEIEMENKEVKA